MISHQYLTNNLSVSGLIGIILITLSPSTWAFINIEQDNETHYTSGAEIFNLPSPLFYDTFVPIIYEINLPSWNFTTLTIEWPANYSNECETSDAWGDNWNNYACPVAYHMNHVIQHYSDSLMDWKSFNSTEKTGTVDVYSCHEIMSHFKSYSLGHEERDEYLFEDLKNCPLGQLFYETLALQPQVNSSAYSTMLSRFMDENTNPYKYRITGYSKFATGTNAYSALQTAELLDYVYTSSKWSQAVPTCENKQIPYSLVPKEALGATLKEIERISWSKGNFKLTVPINDFSVYYKLPLTDCIYTTRNSLLIRILVPVKKTPNEYLLASISSIPFLRSEGSTSQICAYNIFQGRFLIEEETGTVIQKECSSGELCLIPDIAHRPVVDYCLGELIRNNSQGIIEHCSIECSQFDTRQLPYFRKLKSNKYAVLGKSTMDIFVSCDGQPYKVLNPPMSVGAWEITLPCQCQLVYQKDILHSMSPCGKELIIREIMPVVWSSLIINTSYHNPDFYYKVEREDRHDNSVNYTGRCGSCGSSAPVENAADSIPILILSAIVVIIFCFNILLMFLVSRLYQRISQLELGNAQRVACNFYETPMYVRANDD